MTPAVGPRLYRAVWVVRSGGGRSTTCSGDDYPFTYQPGPALYVNGRELSTGSPVFDAQGGTTQDGESTSVVAGVDPNAGGVTR